MLSRLSLSFQALYLEFYNFTYYALSLLTFYYALSSSKTDNSLKDM